MAIRCCSVQRALMTVAAEPAEDAVRSGQGFRGRSGCSGRARSCSRSAPNLTVNTVSELTALAKASPGKLNFGSSGIGGSPHLAGELYKRTAQIDIVHIAYKGLAPAITDLLGEQLQILFADIGLVSQHIEVRQAEGPGGDRPRALERVAAFADDDRGGSPRLSGRHVVRLVRARRHAAGGAGAGSMPNCRRSSRCPRSARSSPDRESSPRVVPPAQLAGLTRDDLATLGQAHQGREHRAAVGGHASRPRRAARPACPTAAQARILVELEEAPRTPARSADRPALSTPRSCR